MIGSRIKQARKASGLSLRELAAKAGISAMAISKYENEKATPSSRVLLALAKAMNVRAEYFFRHQNIRLENVEYRKHHKLPAKVQKRIEGNVIEQIERFFELEQFLPTRPIEPFRIPKSIPAKIRNYAGIEEAALELREAWDLGVNPIAEMTDMLEERGIKVFLSDVLHDDKFDGLAVQVDGVPVIVINKDKPGDRQRFTLAHELGHLILKGRLAGELDVEAAANRFAGAFLVPASEVCKELGEKRSWIEPQELYVLKHSYGLSMGGWLHRARELNIISESIYRQIYKLFEQRNWVRQEPGKQYPCEEPQLFLQLVFHALAEDIIGESKAAELLGLSVTDFRAIRKVDHIKAVVNQ